MANKWKDEFYGKYTYFKLAFFQGYVVRNAW